LESLQFFGLLRNNFNLNKEKQEHLTKNYFSPLSSEGNLNSSLCLSVKGSAIDLAHKRELVTQQKLASCSKD